MKNRKDQMVFIISAIVLVITINLLSILFDSIYDIEGLNGISIDSFLTFPLIWGISIYISLKTFKKLPIFLRQPLLRILLWTPIVFLDFTDDRTGYSDTPSYLLYLFNDGLLPISSLLLEPLNQMNDFQDRLIYSNLTLWIGFALIQVVILFYAEKIMKIENEKRWLTKFNKT